MNYTEPNYSVTFAENYFGSVLGKVDDGVSFDGVLGKVLDGLLFRQVHRFMPVGYRIMHPLGAKPIVRFVNKGGAYCSQGSSTADYRMNHLRSDCVKHRTKPQRRECDLK